MAVTKTNPFWMAVTIFLLITIVIGVRVAWSRYSPRHPLEISLTPTPEFQGQIYLGGAVKNPGFYPFTSRDSIETLIKIAGEATSANYSGLKLYVVSGSKETEPQKININRAEAWLLEALPGIGETLAQRIIDYRQQHGPFRNISELLKVADIGTKTYEQLEHLITVAD